MRSVGSEEQLRQVEEVVSIARHHDALLGGSTGQLLVVRAAGSRDFVDADYVEIEVPGDRGYTWGEILIEKEPQGKAEARQLSAEAGAAKGSSCRNCSGVHAASRSSRLSISSG